MTPAGGSAEAAARPPLAWGAKSRGVVDSW